MSVVIPAKNDGASLPALLGRLPRGLFEVILVDGDSVDDTVAAAREALPGIRVIRQARRGRGNALACGFAAASGDFIVTLDADGSTDPAEIPRFVEALAQGADFAMGSRFLSGAGSSRSTRFRKAGSRWLNKLLVLVYDTPYTDLCYGYKAFRRDCLPVLDLTTGAVDGAGPDTMRWGDGFEAETLIHLRVARAGLRVAEVPSFERDCGGGASNLNAFSDGIRVLKTIRTEHKRSHRR